MDDTCNTACIMERQAAGFCAEAREAQEEIARLRDALEDAAQTLEDLGHVAEAATVREIAAASGP